MLLRMVIAEATEWQQQINRQAFNAFQLQRLSPTRQCVD
jgi:hypothetical protein